MIAISRVSSASARGAVRERGEELGEHVVVGPVALVLAAVVVGAQPATAGQPQVRPVGPRRAALAAALGGRRGMRRSRNAVLPSPALPVMMTSR